MGVVTSLLFWPGLAFVAGSAGTLVLRATLGVPGRFIRVSNEREAVTAPGASNGANASHHA